MQKLSAVKLEHFVLEEEAPEQVILYPKLNRVSHHVHLEDHKTKHIPSLQECLSLSAILNKVDVMMTS